MDRGLVNAEALAELLLAFLQAVSGAFDLVTFEHGRELCITHSPCQYPLRSAIMQIAFMADSAAAKRLKEAREKAGFDEASAAARALGIPEPTYMAHENASRGFRGRAEQYARRYGVSLEWLLTGKGPRKGHSYPQADEKREAPLVGYVGAGAEAHFYAEGQLAVGGNGDARISSVELPPGGNANTVAVQVVGSSMRGIANDGWLIYYDEVRRPPTSDLIGRLCVVELEDGRVLVKELQNGRKKGRFDLESVTDLTMRDQKIVWAARVTWIKPR